MSRALIGLDGLAKQDLQEFTFHPHLDWHQFQIATNAHTAPSWNAIFTGEWIDGHYDFWQTPAFDEIEAGKSVAQHELGKWTYQELNYHLYPWEQLPVTVTSAPVVTPTYSDVWDDSSMVEIGWPTSKQEMEKSLDLLTRETMNHEQVITVFPFPDKCNHLASSGEWEYSMVDRRKQMLELREVVGEILEVFDEWLLISDHGRPSEKEWVTDNLWVTSHEPVGLVASNAVDVSGVGSNLDAYGYVMEFFND